MNLGGVLSPKIHYLQQADALDALQPLAFLPAFMSTSFGFRHEYCVQVHREYTYVLISLRPLPPIRHRPLLLKFL